MGTESLVYESLLPSEELLNTIRMDLYHSEKTGYFVIRNFLEERLSSHIINFWSKEIPKSEESHKSISVLNPMKNFYFGCPNYDYKNEYGHTYLNYFWNDPVDEVTYGIAWKIHELRNSISSKLFYNGFFPIRGNQSTSFRVVRTLRGKEIVAPHIDFRDKEFFDPSMLQATLILSEHEKDYSGDGMFFTQNDGKKICLNKDLNLKKGDLVLWNYGCLHSVENINTTPEHLGFLRIIFPPALLNSPSTEKKLESSSGKELMAELKRRAKKKILK